MNHPAGACVHDRVVAHGVVLRRLSREDLEQVRAWRNDPAVSSFMEAREHITAEMQERWFSQLEPDRQYFYVVETDGRGVGVVNLKNLDTVRRTAESGIYLAQPGERGRGLGRSAYRALLDHGFGCMGLQTVTARILHDNPRSVRLHLGLGYRLAEGQEGIRNQLYVLRQADYLTLP